MATVRVAVALPPITLVGIVIVSPTEKPSPESITVTAVILPPLTVNSSSQPTAPAPLVPATPVSYTHLTLPTKRIV